MRILLDENFPKSAADVITAAGHEVISFAAVCEFGADDEEVFVRAQKLGAVILTSDRDFYHTVPVAPCVRGMSASGRRSSSGY